MSNKENKSIIKTIWNFMNKSPILSAIIISFAAILGTQGYKLYTYIYWLPYFKLFEVPTYYFEDVVFDKYELFLEVTPKIILVILLFILFNFLEKKSKLETKLGFFPLLLLNLTETMMLFFLSIILVTQTSLPIFLSHHLLSYICLAIWVLIFKKSLSKILTKKLIKPTVSLLAIFTSLFLVVSCSIVYINGYNHNVVNAMYSESRVVDNKFIVFETSEHYYVIACEEKDENSVKVYRDSYAFIEKEKQNVMKKHYKTIYNEYDWSLSDAPTKFTTVYW
ncbi:MAG: hypothetical protein IIX16_00215 [Clostridia bacterium]|nr:hypothetical protein [Clostridia bacterium]